MVTLDPASAVGPRDFIEEGGGRAEDKRFDGRLRVISDALVPFVSTPPKITEDVGVGLVPQKDVANST